MIAVSTRPVEEAIASMLVENTGVHLLDSGGSSGRAWQRTRERTGWRPGDPLGPLVEYFRAQPPASIDEWGMPSINTFHFLVERLDYDPAIARRFDLFSALHPEMPYLETAYHFLERLVKKGEDIGFGPYGEDRFAPGIFINTYNHESFLDRVLQFALFQVHHDGFLPEGGYVLLQIHGGADVRGGYTAPRLFIADELDRMLTDADLLVQCEGVERLPEGIVRGQISLEGEVTRPTFEQHCWSTTYDGSYLTNIDNDRERLFFDPRDVDRDEDVVATKVDDTWRCPHDGSPLHAAPFPS